MRKRDERLLHSRGFDVRKVVCCYNLGLFGVVKEYGSYARYAPTAVVVLATRDKALPRGDRKAGPVFGIGTYLSRARENPVRRGRPERHIGSEVEATGSFKYPSPPPKKKRAIPSISLPLVRHVSRDGVHPVETSRAQFPIPKS